MIRSSTRSVSYTHLEPASAPQQSAPPYGAPQNFGSGQSAPPYGAPQNFGNGQSAPPYGAPQNFGNGQNTYGAPVYMPTRKIDIYY